MVFKEQTVDIDQFLKIIMPPDAYISVNTLNKIRNHYKKKVQLYKLKQVNDLKK